MEERTHCPVLRGDNAELLLAYADRTLGPEAAAELDRHARQCGECRRLLEGQRAIWSALDAWELEAISADFNRKLHRAIDAEASRGWWTKVLDPVFRPVLPFSMRPAVPVAASCLAVAALLMFQTPQLSDTPKQAGIEIIDVEQVESTLDDLEVLRALDRELNLPPGKPNRSL